MIKLFIWTVGETFMALKMVVKFQIWKTKNTGKHKGQPPLPKPYLPCELNVKRHHRKAATRGQTPLTQDHVTVHRTDWLFISNCEPIAEMRRLRSGQMWHVKLLNNPTTDLHFLRYTLSENDEPHERWGLGWSPKMKSKWWGKQRKTHGQEKKKKRLGERDRVRKYSAQFDKKGERWQHFTCWRMKVFIVAKMRATLQKQHRDTTVTQPGSQLQPLMITYCPVILQVILFHL